MNNRDTFETDTTGAIAANYTAITGTWQVHTTTPPEGSKAFGQPSGLVTDGQIVRRTGVSQTDMRVVAKHRWQRAAGAQAAASVIRLSVDGQNWYLINPNATGMDCFRCVSGTISPIGGSSNFGFSLADGDVYWTKFECVGTTVRWTAWKDGTSEPITWLGSTTDAGVTAAGTYGFRTFKSGSYTGPTIVDDVRGTDAGVSWSQPTDITPATATIDQLATSTLTANNFTGGAVTWSTSAAGVATVNGAGVVTGVAHGQATGQTATITATGVANPAQTATAVVTVRAVSVTGLPDTALVPTGGTRQFSATVAGSTNTAKTWTSSNAGVATVDSNGLVTAVAAGTTTITARASADTNRTDTCTVTVAAAAQRLFGHTFSVPGLSVGYSITLADGTVYQSRTTTGVIDVGSGAYHVDVVIPLGAAAGTVLMDDGVGTVQPFFFDFREVG